MKVKFIISELAHKKVMHWVSKSNKEVSGFGVTSRENNNGTLEFRVHDVFLLEQEVGGAHTDIDAKALGKLMHKVLKDTTYRNVSKYQLNWWWHSHVRMNTFWSTTDTDTIKSIGKNGLCLASVFNQQGDIRSALAYASNNPVFGESTVMVDEVDTVYEYTPDARIPHWDKEFDECVKTYSYTSQYSQMNLLNTDTGQRFNEYNGLYEENMRWGLVGCGAKQEADYLKMSVNSYMRIIDRDDKRELEDLEARLYVGIETGELRCT